jgi:hypothetical protein
MLQRLSTVTLHFPAFFSRIIFFFARSWHSACGVSLTWGANAKFVVAFHLPPIFHSVCMTSITQFWFITMAKTKRTPCQPLINTNPTGLAARVAAICPSPLCFQPPRAHHPPVYMTQDQRGGRSMSLISTVAAAKATTPGNDSGDDNDNNEDDDVRSIGKKGSDGGDDKQGVKEGQKGVKMRILGLKGGKKHVVDNGDDEDNIDNDDDEGQKGVKKLVSGPKGGKRCVMDNGDDDNNKDDNAKATKPGGKDSEDDDDNKEKDKDNEEVQRGNSKRGDVDDGPSTSMGTGSSLSSSNEVVT